MPAHTAGPENSNPAPRLAEEDRPPSNLSLEEYLHSSWSPDCDFVDGCIVERNLGTFRHSCVVTFLLWQLSGKEEWKTSNMLPLPSVRMRVSSTRIRVPDVCVTERSGFKEPILTHVPLAVFEVLEEEDRFTAAMEKLSDYERFGVEHIWVINPIQRRVDQYIAGNLNRVQTGELTVPGTSIRVVLSEMFAELDRV